MSGSLVSGARELLAQLILQQRKLLESDVDLSIDQSQLLLFDGQRGLQVRDLLGEVLRRLGNALGVQAERAGRGVGEITDGGGEIAGEVAGGGLQEVLHRGEIAGKRRSQSSAVHTESAVVVEVDADAGEIDDPGVAGGEYRRAEQCSLRFAQRTIRF